MSTSKIKNIKKEIHLKEIELKCYSTAMMAVEMSQDYSPDHTLSFDFLMGKWQELNNELKQLRSQLREEEESHLHYYHHYKLYEQYAAA